MKLSATFEAKLAMECPVCEQLITIAGIQEANSKTMLVGAVKYAVCRCGQLVDDVTPDYVQRFNKPRVFAHVG